MNIPVDVYSFRARFIPALVSVLPAAITVVSFSANTMTWWTPLWAAITAFGGTFLISELGRDSGKSKESRLFEEWGGKPTTQRLRYRDAPNEQVLLSYRRKIPQIESTIVFPTEQDEVQDPDKADDLYEAAANVLRERTRDRSEFPLLFQALCEYGFRRNLWGLKPFGLVISLVATALTIIAGYVAYAAGNLHAEPTLIVSGALNVLISLAWLVRIGPDWVKIAAFAYADRLLATSLVLPDR